MRALATWSKNGTPLQRAWFDWSQPVTSADHDFTPGAWDLELELGDGRIQHVPFVVTADANAPVIEVRVLP